MVKLTPLTKKIVVICVTILILIVILTTNVVFKTGYRAGVSDGLDTMMIINLEKEQAGELVSYVELKELVKERLDK